VLALLLDIADHQADVRAFPNNASSGAQEAGNKRQVAIERIGAIERLINLRSILSEEPKANPIKGAVSEDPKIRGRRDDSSYMANTDPGECLIQTYTITFQNKMPTLYAGSIPE
jgi:hypothetical protein